MGSGFNIKVFDILDSTNDTAKELAGQGTYHAAVLARQQSKGRGRSGNEWISPAGNLYLSVIIDDQISLKNAGQLSFVTAISLRECLSDISEGEILNKWPNDLSLNGNKVSGILLESEAYNNQTKWIVIGLGVNIKHAPDGAAKLDSDMPPEDLAARFLKVFSKKLRTWRDDGFAPIQKEWLTHAKGLGQEITVRLPNETKHGIFKTIDENGCLILAQDAGDVKIASGDVFFN